MVHSGLLTRRVRSQTIDDNTIDIPAAVSRENVQPLFLLALVRRGRGGLILWWGSGN